MANPHRGDTPFTTDDGREFTLRFSVDAICQLEAASGKSIVDLGEIFNDPAKITMTMVRQVLWAGLRDHHKEITLVEAGELVVAGGGMVPVLFVINKAFERSVPTMPDQTNQEAAAAAAPAPNLGTGPASSTIGASSAPTPTLSGGARQES